MPQRVLDGGKTSIRSNHREPEAMLAAMRVTLFRRHACLCGNGLEHPEERRAVEFAALLGNEYVIASVLPRLPLFEPSVQDPGDRQQRLTLYIRQREYARSRALQSPNRNCAVLHVDVG